MPLLLSLAFSAGTARGALVFKEKMMDAGEVRSGVPLMHSFAFVNEGTTAVEITGARASCGCMTPRLEKKSLQPGERGMLTLEVNTFSQAAGPHQWQTTLTYRAGSATYEAVVLLQARIVTEVTIQPASMTFFANSAMEHELVLTDLRAKPLTITGTKTTTSQLQLQVSGEYQDQAGHAVRKLRLKMDGEFSEGRHDEILAIYTDDPVYRELKVPITVIKQSRQRVTATPDDVTLTTARGRPVPSQIVLIRDKQNQKVVIENATADHPALTCHWAQGPGAMATLKIQVDYRQLSLGPLTGAVYVEVSEPARQSLIIPISCAVK